MLTSGSVVVGDGRFSQVTCEQVMAVTRQKAQPFFFLVEFLHHTPSYPVVSTTDMCV